MANQEFQTMPASQREEKGSLYEKIRDLFRRLRDVRSAGYSDRRNRKERRTGQDRRISQRAFSGPDQRSGEDRRKCPRRTRRLRIPIFIKLATLSTLLILLIISSIGFSILKEQRNQFTGQLISLGESLVRIAKSNAPDKILGEEDLALFQLVKDIAENEQVIYALITNKRNIVMADSRMEGVGRPCERPRNIQFVSQDGGLRRGFYSQKGEELLFFEAPVTYQDLKVGAVHLVISKKKILENLREAKIYFLLLTMCMTALGIFLSLGLSLYFSRPIRQLSEITRALGMGEFGRRISVDRDDELGDLAYAFNRMAEDLELNEKVKASFGRYVTPEIVEMILSNPDRGWMKGSKVQATVLFSDIRGFTSLSENRDPEGVVDLLNDYLTRVTDAVIKYGGHVNKFVGDEVMAVFGAPIPKQDHAEAAVRAALDIQAQIEELNLRRITERAPIGVGVGINSGEMVEGNLGSEKRMEYTVIGDNVNIASRLTSIALAGEILISKQTFDLIRDNGWLRAEERNKVPVKGRIRQITIYSVLRHGKEGYHGLEKEAVHT